MTWLSINQLGFEFYVSDNIASTIYPADFAMINTKEHFVLKASTSSVPVTKGDLYISRSILLPTLIVQYWKKQKWYLKAA